MKDEKNAKKLADFIAEDPPEEDAPQVEEGPQKRAVVTTTLVKPRKKKTMITTGDLPTFLPNYHGVKKWEKGGDG